MRRASSLSVLVMLGLVGPAGCRVAPDALGQPGADPPSLAADDDDSAPSATSGASRGGSSASPSSGGSPSASAPARSPAEEPELAAGAAGAAEKPAVTGPPSASPSPSASGAPASCDAQTVSFDEIQSGEVRSNVKVRVDATATSQKFLLSHAHSGSCLFGAFVGTEPGPDGPRGLLVVSYGDDAPDGESCVPGRDAIPDALAPGDAVSADGYLSAYAPSGCEKAPSPQLMVDAACPLVRSGRREPPAPVTLTTDEADALARGTDAALLRRFAGGLVRLASVSAALPTDGSGAVAPYGVVAFNETALELHNDLEYGDLSLGGPGDAAKSLVFPYPTAFSSVTGLVYLDYCTWSLTPRSRCTDLAPASRNCP